MADNAINVVLKLRKDTETNYNKVKDSFIPADGEVCLVETTLYGLRSKIGDGFRTFGQLEYTDNQNNVVFKGYYLNNKFYTDSTYTVEMEKGEKHLYIDKNANCKMYIWNGSKYEPLTPQATDSIPGVMKLYQTAGPNTDGTMSQKSITDGVNAIKLVVDDSDNECLVLDLPWD